MIKLLYHQWKETTRSSFWQKSVWLNIILGIVSLYLILNLLILSFFADKILEDVFPDLDIVQAFSKLLFFYFIMDLFIRFLMQSLPTLSIQPYLTLPIKKSSLFHYPLLRSISSIFNYFAILMVLPFFLKIVCFTNDAAFSFLWGITVLSMIFINNFLTFSLKKYFMKRPLLVFSFLIMIGLLFYLEKVDRFNSSDYFSSALMFISNHVTLVIIPIVFAILSYCMGYVVLKKNAYAEETQDVRNRNTELFSFLSGYGEVGNLLKTEIKLILRNKRSKSVLYMSIFFLLYGFIFYRPENINNDWMLIMAGIIIISMFGINYGQFFYSWEGTFFDAYLVNKISTLDFVKSKYLLFAITCVLGYVFSLFYGFISLRLIFVNFAILLYSVGISSVLLLSICTYNTKSIDLGRSQFMNYQGTSASQFLMVLPILGLPALIYIICNIFDSSQYVFYVLGLLGVLGIVFNRFLLQLIANQLMSRKYKMALSFRQK